MDFLFSIYNYFSPKWIDFKYWLNPDAFHSGARRGTFLIDELQLTDYSYWDGKRFYTSHQAACLIHGFTPGYNLTTYPQYVQDRQKHLIDSVFDKSLNTGELTDEMLNTKRMRKFFAPSLTFQIDDLSTYCEQEGIESAFITRELRKVNSSDKAALSELQAELAKVRAEVAKLKSDSRVECLNESHEYYSQELGMAVDAWLSIYGDCQFDKGNKASKTIIEDWLTENHPYLKGKTLSRISTVINPYKFKDGGSPSSGK